MTEKDVQPPALVVEYTDPQEGFKGWLVIDTLNHGLCAGGMRVQVGLTREHLINMARNMTRKMQICGLRVDGAKCGIGYDPAAPGKKAAIARMMAAIKPYILERYSMGPDLNVEMDELETIGRGVGIPAVKTAVAKAQGWELDYFLKRYQILKQEVDGWPLGKIRAGYGVAAAALAVLDHLGIAPEKASVAVQGFGTLAKATAYSLYQQGVKISGLADAQKCVITLTGGGLDIDKILKTQGTLLPETGYGNSVVIKERREILNISCDILIPAAIENAIGAAEAAELKIKAVVPGANLAVTPEAENLLYKRKILALPDFLAGSGGPLSMEGLFAPRNHPAPTEVLRHIASRMSNIVKQVLIRSAEEKISPCQAALRLCTESVPQPGTRPYGEPQ